MNNVYILCLAVLEVVMSYQNKVDMSPWRGSYRGWQKCNLCDASVFLMQNRMDWLMIYQVWRDPLKLNLIKQGFFEEGVGLREPILKVYKDVKVDVTVGSRVADSCIKFDDVGSGVNSYLMKGNGWSLKCHRM
ncbi:hypothetical protein Hanom_Chr05g00416521 [Helianthus anomalus]